MILPPWVLPATLPGFRLRGARVHRAIPTHPAHSCHSFGTRTAEIVVGFGRSGRGLFTVPMHHWWDGDPKIEKLTRSKAYLYLAHPDTSARALEWLLGRMERYPSCKRGGPTWRVTYDSEARAAMGVLEGWTASPWYFGSEEFAADCPMPDRTIGVPGWSYLDSPSLLGLTCRHMETRPKP